MTTLILTTSNPETECRVLIFALQEWLKEQPEHPLPLSETRFVYDVDRGVLSSVTVTMDED